MDGNLQGQSNTMTIKKDFKDNFVVKKDNFLTVCSMNLGFRREVIPIFYQLPMDDNIWKVGRFDDIWSGLNLKKAGDLLGKHIYNGHPLCVHNKAPRSTFRDLSYEVAGLELNEYYSSIIKSAEGQTYKEIGLSIADRLKTSSKRNIYNSQFLQICGEHMEDWVKLITIIEEDN